MEEVVESLVEVQQNLQEEVVAPLEAEERNWVEVHLRKNILRCYVR